MPLPNSPPLSLSQAANEFNLTGRPVKLSQIFGAAGLSTTGAATRLLGASRLVLLNAAPTSVVNATDPAFYVMYDAANNQTLGIYNHGNVNTTFALFTGRAYCKIHLSGSPATPYNCAWDQWFQTDGVWRGAHSPAPAGGTVRYEFAMANGGNAYYAVNCNLRVA